MLQEIKSYLEENTVTGDPIDRYQHQSQNSDETDTDTSTNKKHNIVDIEASFTSDSEGSSVGGAVIEVTADTDDEGDPTLWFSKVLPLLLLFQKVSLLFIALFGTYLYIDETMIIFYGRSFQTHIIQKKPLKEGYKWFVLTDYITYYILNFTLYAN